MITNSVVVHCLVCAKNRANIQQRAIINDKCEKNYLLYLSTTGETMPFETSPLYRYAMDSHRCLE